MLSFKNKTNRRIAESQNELIKTHYTEVETMYRQMRGWRHDYRNHIQVLKTFAEQRDYESICKYLDGLETDLSSIDTVIKTGNKMADAILNSKITFAKSKNIAIIADAQIPLALTTPEVDLCIIIGNLFDNAVEAAAELPDDKRIIRIYMDMKGNQLYMSFTNMTSGVKQIKVSGIFRSRKGEGHGFGLLRIDTIVKRHGGYINRNSEDGAFTTEILLPQTCISSP